MTDTRIGITVKGSRPLLQNRFSGGDEEEQSGSKKTKKVYDDNEECLKRLYLDKEVVCQPALHFEATMIKSAVDFKFEGRKTYKEPFKAGVFVDPLFIPHKFPEWVVDKQAVRIGMARILRCRPRFDEWELDFSILIRDDRIEPLIVKEVLESAGKYYGVGDQRPRYGQFDVVKFEVL